MYLLHCCVISLCSIAHRVHEQQACLVQAFDSCSLSPCLQDFLLKYLGATVAVVLIIGPFFGNHLRPVDNVLGRAHMLSTMRYHTSVVIYLFAALGTLGSSSRKLMRLSAYADRIMDMQRAVKGLASDTTGELNYWYT